MYVVMNRIFVKPEYRDALEERFRQRAGEVDKMPGFIRTQVLRPDDPEVPFVVVTEWESKEAFEAWTRSEAFQKGHRQSGTLPPDAFLGPSRVEAFTVVAGSPDRRPQ